MARNTTTSTTMPPALVGPGSLPPGMTRMPMGSSIQDVLNQRLGSASSFSRWPGKIGGFITKHGTGLERAGKFAVGALSAYDQYQQTKLMRERERREREEAERRRRDEEAAAQALAPVGANLLGVLTRRLGARSGGG